jgi:NAD-specific glutamate dehydrogenase
VPAQSKTSEATAVEKRLDRLFAEFERLTARDLSTVRASKVLERGLNQRRRASVLQALEQTGAENPEDLSAWSDKERARIQALIEEIQCLDEELGAGAQLAREESSRREGALRRLREVGGSYGTGRKGEPRPEISRA